MLVSKQLYQIKEWIRQGDIVSVWRKLEHLCGSVVEFKEEENELILLEASYHTLQKKIRGELLTLSDEKVELAKISSRTTDFITHLQSLSPDRENWAAEEEQMRRERAQQHLSMGFQPSMEETELTRMIRRLGLEEDMGLIHLVNCNRNKESDMFWEAYDNQESHAFQFYFIPSCSRQQPDSFSERMIYELIEEELDEDWTAISFDQKAHTDRLKVTPLPLGRNLRNCQRKLKKYFSKRFEMDVVDFTSFLHSGTPALGYEAVATVFHLDESEWKMDLMETYLDWIIYEFSIARTQIQTRFYFFFVVNLPQVNRHVSPQAEAILKQLETLDSLHESSTLLPHLHPVKQTDIISWLRNLGARNQDQMEAVLRVLVNSLDRQESIQQFAERKTLDMTHVEPFQALVYQIQAQFNAHVD